jgi:hypothetical protein
MAEGRGDLRSRTRHTMNGESADAPEVKDEGEWSQPLILPMAPELRRCTLYVVAGVLLLSLVAWSLRDLLPKRDGPDLLIWAGMVAAATVLAVSAHRWRVRVDERGVARRRFLSWDLWPWEAFEQGLVREGTSGSSYEWPGRPSGPSKLILDWLADDNAERVSAIIRGRWARPSPPDAPEALAIRSLGWEARFAPEGPSITRRGRTSWYGWHEVESLRIRRLERDRSDFNQLELRLHDQALTLRVNRQHSSPSTSWRGPGGTPTPTAEEVVAILRRHVPRDRILVVSLSEPPASREELEDRLELLDKREQGYASLRRVFWVLGALSIALCVIDDRGRPARFGMLVPLGGPWGLMHLVLRHFQRQHQSRREEIEATGRELPAPVD